MKKNHRCSKNALTSLEYALVIAAAILALAAMTAKLKSRLQAAHKESIDAIGEGRVGTPAMGGRTRPFVYPVLPAGPATVPVVTPPLGAGSCDEAQRLSEIANQKAQAAVAPMQVAAAARADAAAAAADWAQAAKEAMDAKLAADAAKDAYDAAVAAAEAAQQDCDDCRASIDDPPPDCTPICDDAAAKADARDQAYQDWQDKLQIQLDKERIRDQKEVVKNQKEADAAAKEAVANQAANEAQQAAEDAQAALDACAAAGG